MLIRTRPLSAVNLFEDYSQPFNERNEDIQVADLAIAGYNYAVTVKNTELALEMFDKALARASADGKPEILKMKASALLEQQHLSEAVKVLEELAQLNESLPEVFYQSGICYGRLDRNREGLFAFRRYESTGKDPAKLTRARLWIEYLQNKEN